MNNYVELKTKVQLCKNSNMKYLRNDEVDRVEDISINTNLPKLDRIVNFLEMVKNPYVFMVDGMKVKLEFASSGKNINQCFESLVMNRKNV